MAPLVSVIVPTYNPKSFLLSCIYSIYSQTYQSIEVIVVDDCSTDPQSLCLLQSLQSHYKFNLIHLERNSGSCAKPINVALAKSRGDFVSIIAQDDLFTPVKLELQVNFLLSNPEYSMVYSNTTIVDSSARPLSKRTPKRKSGFIFDDLILQRFYIPAISTLVRRSTYQAIGLFDESLIIEDWDMWLRISSQFSIGYLPLDLAVYRLHADSLSHVHAASMPIQRQQIIRKWLPLPIAHQALDVALFLDSASGPYTPLQYLRHLFVVSAILGQPLRVLRIVLQRIPIVKSLYHSLMRPINV